MFTSIRPPLPYTRGKLPPCGDEGAEYPGDVDDAGGVEGVEGVEDTGDVEDIEGVEDVGDVGDVGNIEGVEDIGDAIEVGKGAYIPSMRDGNGPVSTGIRTIV